MQRKVYSGRLKLNGEEHLETLRAANNYASILIDLERFEEVESLLRKEIPVARRVLGESQEVTLQMRWNYAISLYDDPDATLDDLHEAVNTLEDTTQSAWRVLGSAHPHTVDIERHLRLSRAALEARETEECLRMATNNKLSNPPADPRHRRHAAREARVLGHGVVPRRPRGQRARGPPAVRHF